MPNKRYNARNKGSRLQWAIIAVACLLSAFFLILSPSLAQYAADYDGKLTTGIAKWQIKVNGVDVTQSSPANVPLSFVPNSFTPSGDTAIPKIKPGDSGYVEIKIDPAGTEVSFSYTVEITGKNLPEGMTVSGYSINGGTEVSFADNVETVNGTAELNGKSAFAESDAVSIKLNWAWAANSTYDKFAEYNITAKVTVIQYTGSVTAEAQSL